MPIHSETIRIPIAALATLLGGDSTMIPAEARFRRSRVQREWPCGCAASYAFDRVEDADWAPCPLHAPTG